jgi:hypothetical protein
MIDGDEKPHALQCPASPFFITINHHLYSSKLIINSSRCQGASRVIVVVTLP